MSVKPHQGDACAWPEVRDDTCSFQQWQAMRTTCNTERLTVIKFPSRVAQTEMEEDRDRTAEIEAQAAMQALRDRQQVYMGEPLQLE